MDFQRRPYPPGFPDDRLIWKLFSPFRSISAIRRFNIRYEASRKIQWKSRKRSAVRAISLHFWFRPPPSPLPNPFLFSRFDNWTICRINESRLGRILYSPEPAVDRVFETTIGRFIYLERWGGTWGRENAAIFDFGAFLKCARSPPRQFFRRINRPIPARTLIPAYAPRTCIADRRIYILRAQIIELCNIRFRTTAWFIDPTCGGSSFRYYSP